MSGSQRPLEPVAPDGMELLFFYRCPHCKRDLPKRTLHKTCPYCKKPLD